MCGIIMSHQHTSRQPRSRSVQPNAPGDVLPARRALVERLRENGAHAVAARVERDVLLLVHAHCALLLLGALLGGGLLNAAGRGEHLGLQRVERVGLERPQRRREPPLLSRRFLRSTAGCATRPSSSPTACELICRRFFFSSYCSTSAGSIVRGASHELGEPSPHLTRYSVRPLRRRFPTTRSMSSSWVPFLGLGDASASSPFPHCAV